VICEGDCINFTDLSTNIPTSWQWSFPGATPSTSGAKNPFNICYDTVGFYDVQLIATNTDGSDTKLKTAYITVTPNPLVTAPPDTTICVGEPFQLNAVGTGGTGSLTYTWNPPTFLSCTNCQNPICTPTSIITYNVIVTDINNCSDAASVTISVVVCSGIEENDGNYQLKIYPNPGKNNVTLTMNISKPQDINISIFDVKGKRIYNDYEKHFSGTYNKQIDLSNYAKGLYHLQVVTKDGVVNRKVVIQ